MASSAAPRHPLGIVRWSLLWQDRSDPHLIYGDAVPVLFMTRQEAREYAAERFGYIGRRPDLRRAPHHWRMPIPIRVEVAPWEETT